MRWTGREDSVWSQRTSWDVLVMMSPVREGQWCPLHPHPYATVILRITSPSSKGSDKWGLKTHTHTPQNQTKIKDKRTVFSFWKAAIKKGRQLVCSAVSLCGYPSPLASALLPFENTAEAKKKQLSLNWMKKKKKNTWRRNQIWHRWIKPSLDRISNPQHCSGCAASSNASESAQWWQIKGLWRGWSAWAAPSWFTKQGHNCLSPRTWSPPFAQEQQLLSVSSAHQPGSVLCGFHKGMRNQRDSSEG